TWPSVGAGKAATNAFTGECRKNNHTMMILKSTGKPINRSEFIRHLKNSVMATSGTHCDRGSRSAYGGIVSLSTLHGLPPERYRHPDHRAAERDERETHRHRTKPGVAREHEAAQEQHRNRHGIRYAQREPRVSDEQEWNDDGERGQE